MLAPRAAPARVSTPDDGRLRRDALLGLGVAAAAVPLPAFAAPQLKECPKGAQNCYSTASGTIATWTWPKSSTKAQAIKDIEAVLDSYPQTGQAGVDGGGWSRAVDELVDNGYARFEFKSAGTGNLARFLNGGKPFTDDLEFAVEESGVCVRSSSRVGDLRLWREQGAARGAARVQGPSRGARAHSSVGDIHLRYTRSPFARATSALRSPHGVCRSAP